MYYACKDIKIREQIDKNGAVENILSYNGTEIPEYDLIALPYDAFVEENPYIRAYNLPSAFQKHLKCLSSDYILEAFKLCLI